MHAASEPLADLLRTLFTTEELRLHLAQEPEGVALVDSLPGSIASRATYAHEAALGLARRGLVTDEFFERLAAVRANCRDDIRRAHGAWLAASRPASGLLLGGRYRLAEKLGEGGVASVWRAVDEQTGQMVAVKLLHLHHEDDAQVRRRFYRGCMALAGLQHPSIVRVLATVVEDERRCFYVMEYVPGVTLDVCERERGYAKDVLIALVLQVGDALAHVHQRGLLHRDVKPANILVVDVDVVRLIDFDLVTGDEFVAQTTQGVGTGIYMPPEAHTTDRKTTAYDVYSLARTIEFILRGREPTVSELFDVGGLPGTAEVRAILRGALQLDPRSRVRDVANFCADLRAALAAEGRAPPSRPQSLAWPYPRGMARVLPSFNRGFGVWFTIFPIVIGVLMTAMFSALDIFRYFAPRDLIPPALLFLLFPVIGLSALNTSRRERRAVRRLWAEGLQCWGQVHSAAPTGAARMSGGLRWMAMGLVVDAYPVAATGAAGPPKPIRVECAWYISDLQVTLIQPGSWVALLVDRSDPSVVQLEAIRTANGTVAPLQ